MNKAKKKKLEVLFAEERWEALESLSRSYIKADKRDAAAWRCLAAAQWHLNEDSLPASQRAVELEPKNPFGHFQCGNAMKWLNKKHEAIDHYRRAIELKADYAEAYCNLGNALQDDGQPYEAIKMYWHGIKLAPNLVNIQLNMGNCLLTVGQHDKAIKLYTMATEIKPDFMEAHNAKLFAKDLTPSITVADAQEERRQWNANFAAKLRENIPYHGDLNPERRLRLGYVSADFRKHSAARAFGSVIANHDHEQLEVFAYHTSKHKPDEYTAFFQTKFDHWKDVSQLSDQQLSDLIREDCIDVLVDLGGHTGGNRLLTFARKPAPIQVTAWGYALGTGMTAMDAFLADPVIVPEEERHLYAEEVRYLPNVVGSMWLETFPDVSQLPAFEDGNITFGSINRFAKVTDDTLRLWAQVLLAVPNSGMVLRATELNSEAHKARIIAFFGALGVPSDRLILAGSAPSWGHHMQTLQQVDICLDTFPHGGGVTTLETLMMGVPIITLRWPTVVGRLSASILTTVGLTDWIAETKEEYVAKAIEKASDFRRLALLREELRGRFQASACGDGPMYCRAVENEYRTLWRNMCYNAAHGNETNELLLPGAVAGALEAR